MNAKTWIPLSAAVLLGLAAAMVARYSLKARSAFGETRSVSVVVTKDAIPPGQELTADELALEPIAGKSPPPNSFNDPSRLVGRVTVAPMVPGQPVIETLLAPKGTAPGLQALVPQGMRAMSVEINESSGLIGLLVPGSHVDVVATSLNSQDGDRSVSRTLVQDVPVIAVGQKLWTSATGEKDKDAATSHTVTLLVTPHDAEALDLALSAARIRLVLRGSGDKARGDDDGVNLAELRGTELAAAAAPVTFPAPITAPAQPVAMSKPSAAPARVVTIILGNNEQHVAFPGEHPSDGSPTQFIKNDMQHAIPQ